MATKRVILDKDFGQIIIRTRITARNISMRTQPDGLHVTVPPRSLTSKVLAVIEEYRPQLLEKWQKIAEKPIAAPIDGSSPMKGAATQPKVEPTKNAGTISPPLKPEAMVIAVNSIFIIKAKGSASPPIATRETASGTSSIHGGMRCCTLTRQT